MGPVDLVIAFANHTPAANLAWDLAISAENNAAAACMRQRGLRYTPPTARQTPAWINAVGLEYETTTVAQARRRGLGLLAGIRLSRTVDPGNRYYASLPPKTRAIWAAAFLGSPFIVVRGLVGHPLSIGNTGCLAQGRKAVFGSLQNAVRATVLLSIPWYFDHAWYSTATWISADRSWAPCMRTFGYNVPSMAQLVRRLTHLYVVGGKTMYTKAGWTAEKRAGVAAAWCERVTSVIAGHLAAERQAITRLRPSDLQLLEDAAINLRSRATRISGA